MQYRIKQKTTEGKVSFVVQRKKTFLGIGFWKNHRRKFSFFDNKYVEVFEYLDASIAFRALKNLKDRSPNLTAYYY